LLPLGVHDHVHAEMWMKETMRMVNAARVKLLRNYDGI
jgi:hypothetical protein